jgi:hypothetical protein
MRNIFALTSAVGSMVALMAAYFLPLSLNPKIGNMMPVLHDIWLYIHTNVIIFSYCLIVHGGGLGLRVPAVPAGSARSAISAAGRLRPRGRRRSLMLTAPDGHLPHPAKHTGPGARRRDAWCSWSCRSCCSGRAS